MGNEIEKSKFLKGNLGCAIVGDKICDITSIENHSSGAVTITMAARKNELVGNTEDADFEIIQPK